MPVHDDLGVQLSNVQKNILYGAMLGDGCLSIHKNGKNAQFCYLSKSEQHVNYISNFFEDYISNEGVKTNTYFDKRTRKEYNRTYFKTFANPIFTCEYQKWYRAGKKHIPNNLSLNPAICLVWYIGDGGICHLKRTECIKLATQCFSKEEQEDILLPQLNDFEAKIMKTDVSLNGIQQYFIYIPHRKMDNFLKYIGECPFEDYQYKWNVSDYKYKKPSNHTMHETEFCDLYKKGFTYYAIAKQFNIEPNAVKYYLKKNGLYKQKEKY